MSLSISKPQLGQYNVLSFKVISLNLWLHIKHFLVLGYHLVTIRNLISYSRHLLSNLILNE